MFLFWLNCTKVCLETPCVFSYTNFFLCFSKKLWKISLDQSCCYNTTAVSSTVPELWWSFICRFLGFCFWAAVVVVVGKELGTTLAATELLFMAFHLHMSLQSLGSLFDLSSIVPFPLLHHKHTHTKHQTQSTRLLYAGVADGTLAKTMQQHKEVIISPAESESCRELLRGACCWSSLMLDALCFALCFALSYLLLLIMARSSCSSFADCQTPLSSGADLLVLGIYDLFSWVAFTFFFSCAVICLLPNSNVHLAPSAASSAAGEL